MTSASQDIRTLLIGRTYTQTKRKYHSNLVHSCAFAWLGSQCCHATGKLLQHWPHRLENVGVKFSDVCTLASNLKWRPSAGVIW